MTKSINKSSQRRAHGREELANVKRTDVLDKIIVDYLSGTPDSETEYAGFVRAIIPFISPNLEGSDNPVFPLSDEISAIDPFYSAEEDRERIMNAGRISSKGSKTKVVLYIEIPLLFEKLIKILDSGPDKNTGIYSLHTLLRVDMIEGQRQTQPNEEVIISFKDKKNLREPFFVRYPKNVPVFLEQDAKDKTKIASEAFVS